MIRKLLFLVALVTLPGLGITYGQLKITEIRVRSSDTSTDTDYIEIQGTPGATIPVDTRIVAFSKGGGAQSGVVTGRVQTIAGMTIPDDGYLSICRTSSVITDIDVVDGGINWQSFQNLTFLIIESSTISSSTDVDTDDDGVIDNVFWTTIIDGVSLRARTNAEIITAEEQSARAWDYSEDAALGSGLSTIVGVVSNSTLYHVQRDPLTDAWQVGDSTGSYSDLIYDSHSAPNSLIANDGESRIVSSDLTVYNVIIKGGGSITVAPGATLTVINKVINKGHLTIESGGSLIETTGVFEGTGTYTINRNTQHAGDAKRHNLVGSPVSSINIESLGADSYYAYNEGTDTWSLLAGNPVMTPGQGYSVVGKTNLAFVGTPNSGTIPVSASASAFKLLANPYPCSIKTNEFFTQNSASLSQSTIWLWNDGGSESGQRPTSDYVTINSLGQVQSGGTGAKSSSNYTDGSIGSMQGFFVSTGASGTSLSFTDAMKQSGNNSDASFFRKASDNDVISKTQLTLSNGNSFSEILIAFTESATDGIDFDFDATKVQGASSVQLSSIVQDKPFAIAAFSPLQNSTKVIDLMFSVKEAGNYTLNLENLELEQEHYFVQIIDNESGKSTDISSAGSFSFYSEAVTNSKRFSISFSKSIIASTKALDQGLQVYGSDEGLMILSNQTKASVSIYDINGRVVYSRDQVDFQNNKLLLNVALNASTLYILQVNNQRIKFILN